MSTEITIEAAGVLGLIGVGLYGLLTVRNLFQIIIALRCWLKGRL
ncbi:MAG: hypothetical protein M5U34_17890 [Chloroflexi bacterium]|nr:hypothetical protein [Chloroflexota bacterium]